MNKNFFKFIPAALALVALSSCSADDLWNASVDHELGKKTLVVNEVELDSDEGTMRSSMKSEGNVRVFNKGDQVRAYDDKLQAYDLYDFNEKSTFVTDEKTSDVEEPLYMLFPSNMVHYGSWKKGLGMFALMKLAVYDDTPSNNGTLTYAEEKVDGETAYLSNIPEFGLISSSENGLKAEPVFLTGMLKIKIVDGANHVSGIKVHSLKSDGVTPNPEMPLWGYFDAVLETADGMSTSVNKSRLVKSTETLLDAPTSAHATLEVKLDAEQLKNYTSYIYIPIIPTITKAEAESGMTAKTYPALKVEVNKGSGYEELTTFYGKEIKTNTVYSAGANKKTMEIRFPSIDVKATSIADINAALEKYAAVEEEDLIVNVEVATSSSILIKEGEKLIIPELKNNLVLNIKSVVGNDGETLEIEDKDVVGTGKLTIALDGQNFAADIQSESAHSIEVKQTASETFAGVMVNNENSNFTFNSAIATGKTLLIANAKEVTFKKDPTVDVTVNNGKVIVDKDVTAFASNITSVVGDIVVDGAVTGEITSERGNVTIHGTATTITITDDGVVSLIGKLNAESKYVAESGSVSELTTSGDVLVQLLGEGEAITSSLTLNGTTKQTITLNQGYIKALTATDAKEVAFVQTTGQEGLTAIGAATYTPATTTKPANVDFGTSKWNEKKISDDYLEDYVIGTTGNRPNVYTASQFASKDGSTTIALYADIDLNNKKWTAIATQKGHVTGNGHTIKNVKLSYKAPSSSDPVAKQQGLFGTLSADVAIEVSNLTIDGVSLTDDAAKVKVENLGAFAGSVGENGAKFTKVTVKNVNFAGTTVSRINVGGLIGKAEGDVTLSEVSTAGSIAGYHTMGGLVGLSEEGVNIDAKCASTVTFDRSYDSKETYDLDYLRVGQYVGTVTGNSGNVVKLPAGANLKPVIIAKDNEIKKQINYSENGKAYYYDIVFDQTLIGWSGDENIVVGVTVGTDAAKSYGVLKYTPNYSGDEKGKYFLYYVSKSK